MQRPEHSQIAPLISRVYGEMPDIMPIHDMYKLIPAAYVATTLEFKTRKGRFIAVDDPNLLERHTVLTQAGIPVFERTDEDEIGFSLLSVPQGTRSIHGFLQGAARNPEEHTIIFEAMGGILGKLETTGITAIPHSPGLLWPNTLLSQFAVSPDDTQTGVTVYANLPYDFAELPRETALQQIETELHESGVFAGAEGSILKTMEYINAGWDRAI